MLLWNHDYPKVMNFKVLLFKYYLPKQKLPTNKAYIFNALYQRVSTNILMLQNHLIWHTFTSGSFWPESRAFKYLSIGYFDLKFSSPIKLYIDKRSHFKGPGTTSLLTLAPHIQHVIKTFLFPFLYLAQYITSTEFRRSGPWAPSVPHSCNLLFTGPHF